MQGTWGKKQELAHRKTANCKINSTALTTGICYAIVLARMEYYECYDALVAAKRLTVGRVYNRKGVLKGQRRDEGLTRLAVMELVWFYAPILRALKAKSKE